MVTTAAWPKDPTQADDPDLTTFTRGVAEFVDSQIRPFAQKWEESGQVPRTLFAEAGERGFLGLKYSTDYGGTARPYSYTLAYLRGLARSGAWGTMLSLVIHSEMGTPLLSQYGCDDLKQRYLIPAIAGRLITAIAMTEPEGGSDLAGVRTSARRVSGGFVINGRKWMTGNGSSSDIVTVICTDDKKQRWIPRLSAIIVPRETPGFRVVRKLEKIGLNATDNCELEFDDCFVPEYQLIGTQGRAGFYLARCNAYERLALAACALGAMEQLWAHALEFARKRFVFGKPIIKHQIWRHRFVDFHVDMLSARALIRAAAETIDQGRPNNGLCAAAKIVSTESLQRVAYGASQVFGSRGFLKEEFAARSFIDARALTIGGGTSEVLKEMLADMIL